MANPVYNTVTVNATATLISAADNSRIALIVYNNGANAIYIGFDNSVTSSNGMPILPNSSNTDQGAFGNFRGAIWGITSTGSSDVRYMTWPR